MFFGMASEPKQGVSFALPVSHKSQIESIAKIERRSASEIYRTAIADYVRRWGEQRNVDKAVSALVPGEVATAEDVQP